MPSISIPIREAKEPVDSRQTYLKPSKKVKEKGKKRKSQKVQKSKGEKKSASKEGTPREEW